MNAGTYATVVPIGEPRISVGAGAFAKMRENKNWAPAGEAHADARFLCTCRERRISLQTQSNKGLEAMGEAFALLIMKFVCSLARRINSARPTWDVGTMISQSDEATRFCIETRHLEAVAPNISRSLAFVARPKPHTITNSRFLRLYLRLFRLADSQFLHHRTH